MWDISWLVEELFVSQEKLCFMHLFIFIYICECHWMITWGIVCSRDCVRFGVLWWHYQKFSSCSDITPCHWTSGSHAWKDHNAVEAFWTVRSMIQHRIPEIVNLQVEGIFILVLQYSFVVVLHHVFGWGLTSWTICECELIFMLRYKSQPSKRAQYRSLRWYIGGWVRESSVLWEVTEWWTWSNGLLSSLVFQPSVLLAWLMR